MRKVINKHVRAVKHVNDSANVEPQSTSGWTAGDVLMLGAYLLSNS